MYSEAFSIILFTLVAKLLVVSFNETCQTQEREKSKGDLFISFHITLLVSKAILFNLLPLIDYLLRVRFVLHSAFSAAFSPKSN